jgi:hypothetical protein
MERVTPYVTRARAIGRTRKGIEFDGVEHGMDRSVRRLVRVNSKACRWTFLPAG